mmetsp:Transcript_9425/g.20699  ORF Transcript_9425/g.20699 Transcript_9425/m.20699 type:complete len:269 (-) Transcript_9425:129-935(-)
MEQGLALSESLHAVGNALLQASQLLISADQGVLLSLHQRLDPTHLLIVGIHPLIVLLFHLSLLTQELGLHLFKGLHDATGMGVVVALRGVAVVLKEGPRGLGLGDVQGLGHQQRPLDGALHLGQSVAAAPLGRRQLLRPRLALLQQLDRLGELLAGTLHVSVLGGVLGQVGSPLLLQLVQIVGGVLNFGLQAGDGGLCLLLVGGEFLQVGCLRVDLGRLRRNRNALTLGLTLAEAGKLIVGRRLLPPLRLDARCEVLQHLDHLPDWGI